ncbi:Membrane-associated lipoprotein precursor [Salmonella enterica subsp. enterica serovar Typhimurium str. DT104]|nr:Membrane-associated lipoprotein precursor [Salmonella enterica subsp. enterica serovar Typhimurium str. DT104]
MSGTGVYKDDKLYSLVFANDRLASTALTLNLRSYGYDYHGYYGKYSLPKYDLIYGSKHQRKSYFQAMQQLYKGKNIKTYLFPNGFDDINKVDVFGD